MAFAITADTVRIDGQQIAFKMTRSTAEFPQRHLQFHALANCMFVQQFMDGLIMGDEGQAIGQFKTPTALQGAIRTNPLGADRGLVNHLQGQTWFNAFRGLSGPAS